jgi:hypothetical protein
MEEKKKINYVGGMFLNEPSENAKNFVVCKVSILKEKFTEWYKQELERHKDKKYIKFDIKTGQSGMYAELNLYQFDKKEEEIPDF